MAQHTPGPWEVSATYPDKAKGHTFEPCVSILGLCTLVGEEGRKVRLADIPDVPGPDSEEAANARLIAAAPELLEQTKLLEKFILYDMRRSEKEGDDEGVRLKQFTLHQCRAAIAKATGSP